MYGDHTERTIFLIDRKHRPEWPKGAGIGKTVVSSGMIDRLAARLGRPLVEVPVGFEGRDHLSRIQGEAQAIIHRAFEAGAGG